MASFITMGKQTFQNENLIIPQKKVVDGKSETTKKAKKGGKGLGSRKALKDITNKSSVSQKVPTAKKKIPVGDFNIAEEGFLHDHSKCIEAQNKAIDPYFLDLVLPGYDSLGNNCSLEDDLAKADLDSPLSLSDMDDLPMDEFTDWYNKPSFSWKSPCSQKCGNSPPGSPFPWHYDRIEFKLMD